MNDGVPTSLLEIQYRYKHHHYRAVFAIMTYAEVEGQATHREIMEFFDMPKSTFYAALRKLKTIGHKYNLAFDRGLIYLTAPVIRSVTPPGVIPDNLIFPQPHELIEETWDPINRKWIPSDSLVV